MSTVSSQQNTYACTATALNVHGASWIGDLHGLPVFFNHGNLNSRLFAPAWDKTESVTKEAGVRVIAVDRHGVGASSFDDTLSYSVFAEDVKDLADHLKLQTFAVAGFSSGGPYSMAIAAKFPSRVRALALISSDAPYLLLGEDYIKVSALIYWHLWSK